MSRDIAIIGAGPAGIAASIYLKRAGFEPLLLEKGEIGGLLLNANLVENYPGFPRGIGGTELVNLFKQQLERLEIQAKKAHVQKLLPKKEGFTLVLEEGEERSRSVIIATGTVPKKIGLPGESRGYGKNLFYEIKDMPHRQSKDSAVIVGGGDAAFDYALNLSQDIAGVDIIFRNPRPKCLPLLEERVRKIENIRPHPRTTPLSMENVEGRIKLQCKSEEGEQDFMSDYLLIACGREPDLSILAPDVGENLSIKGDGSTNFPGLYIAGDVRRGHFRQAGIAVGDGILCAMMIEEFMRRVEP